MPGGHLSAFPKKMEAQACLSFRGRIDSYQPKIFDCVWYSPVSPLSLTCQGCNSQGIQGCQFSSEAFILISMNAFLLVSVRDSSPIFKAILIVTILILEYFTFSPQSGD